MAYLGNDLSTIIKQGKKAYKFVASAGQTVFSGADSNGISLVCTPNTFVNVFLNGVRIIKGDDYTLTTNTLTLLTGASLNDELIIVADIENAVFNTYTRSEADTAISDAIDGLVNGTVTLGGNLVIPNSGTIGSASDTDAITIDASGKVGIGTTSPPLAKLEVSEDARIHQVTVGRGAGGSSQNTVLGNTALASNTTGSHNTAVGIGSLQLNTTGGSLTAIGSGALYANETGNGNTAIGKNSGFYITTGSKNTILGSYDGNQGSLDIRTSDNNIVLSDGDGNPRAHCDSSGNWDFNGNLDVQGDVIIDGNLKANRPADLWTAGVVSPDTSLIGGLHYHPGSWRAGFYSNGYRNSSNTWTSLGLNGYTGAAGIDVDPNGLILFRTQASKATGDPVDVTERMRIDSSGNVGVGTSSITQAYPGYTQANINGSNGATLQFQKSGTTYGNIVNDSNAMYLQNSTAIAFGVGGTGTGTERMRIDSSGRVTMPYQPAFKANYNGTSLSVSTYGKITHNREIFDVGGCFNPSLSRFTAPVAGKYLMILGIIYRGDYTNAWIEFFLNGATASNQGGRMHFSTNEGSVWHSIFLTHVFNLSANDYIEVYNGGTSVDYHGNDWHSWSGYLLG